MKAAQLFVQCLEAEGVKCVFALPGEENLVLLDALRTSSIQVITTRHEATAGFMAATYGRLTGKPGVCLTTLGPGATNITTAVAQAALGGMPLVLITAQQGMNVSHDHFQLVNTIDLFKPLTKFQHSCTAPEQIPTAIREAFRQAWYERPGASHLELPEDIAEMEITTGKSLAPFTPTELRRPVAESKSLAFAIRAIEQAKRPVIVVGPGANRLRVGQQLAHVITQFGLPVVATPLGKGVVDERMAVFLGTTALSQGDIHHKFLQQCDVVINLGHDVTEKSPYHTANQTVIDIDFAPATITTTYHPQLEVVGDIASSLKVIRENLQPVPGWDLPFFSSWRETWSQHIQQLESYQSVAITPYEVVTSVRNVVPFKHPVVLDNGMYKIWFARHYQTYHPNTLLLDNTLATMGSGLASATAAALFNKHKSIVCVTGDGGLLMSLSDLGTPGALDLNIVIVVLRDDTYGMVRWKQESRGFAHFAMHVPNPNWQDLASSFGIKYHKASTAPELQSTLRAAIENKGMHLVEVPIDYGLNKMLPKS